MHPLVRFGLLNGVRLMNAARLAAQSDSGGIDRPAPAPAGLFFCRRLRFHISMVPEFDVYTAATAIIRQYGDKARLHATMRANTLLKAGDLTGYGAFKRILQAIKELQAKKPKPGEAVH